MARSSTEAKYRALALASTKMMWLQSLLTESRVQTTYIPIMFCDNIMQSLLIELRVQIAYVPILFCYNINTIHFTSNPVMHARMIYLGN